MKKPNRGVLNLVDLRQSAEQQLTVQLNSPATANNELKLVHELQVHQIELEMLNDNLRSTHAELEKSWACYFDLYELAPVGYLTINASDNILNANLTATTLLDCPRKTLLNSSLTQFILAADQDQYYLHRKQLQATGRTEAIELRLSKHDSIALWVRVEMNQVIDADGAHLYRVVLIDISAQKAKDEYLRQAVALFENAREGIMLTDAATRIILINPALSRLTGYSATEMIGLKPKLLNSGRQDAAFFQALWAKINTCGYWQGEIWNRRRNGEIYPQILSISAVRNENQKITHYVGVYSDISELKDAVKRLDYLAHHDPLTGLPNRLMLFARLEHFIEMCNREHKSGALLMLDLDRFKDVNDSFGHLAGDELLQQVATRLTSRLRGIDTVTRLGGDEFALLLEDLSHPQDAAQVAEEIIVTLNEPWRLSNGTEVRIGVSIGISLYPDHSKTPEDLLKHADAALYQAKEEGRGRFHYFSNELTTEAIRRINLESKLRRAIANNEFYVVYQPQLDIHSGAIIGAEALLRWHNAQEGLIPPNQFIPVAEGTGQIGDIGEWVLLQVCRQGQRWIEAGLPPLRLAVNLSLHQLRHGDIVEILTTILDCTHFPPEFLELELTESALMERESDAVQILVSLRALGIRLAIDDFGTGYSSLSYLKRFPLDLLKIDRSFIGDIPDDNDDKEIVSAIVSMAHALRLQVLAEGVETEAQLNFLSDLGCDFYQGFYKSPGVSAVEFQTLVQNNVLHEISKASPD